MTCFLRMQEQYRAAGDEVKKNKLQAMQEQLTTFRCCWLPGRLPRAAVAAAAAQSCSPATAPPTLTLALALAPQVQAGAVCARL
jgi:hypothetical protein